MSQPVRILVALFVLFVIVGAVLGIDALRRHSQGQDTLAPGNIPVYVNDEMVGGFAPDDLDQLEQVSFVDAEEGKTQEGWRLRDVLLLDVPPDRLAPDTLIVVSSSSRDKEAQLKWAEVQEPANFVMLDLSGRGTLKLVSKLDRLDVRDEWVQDVDRIDVKTTD